MAVLSTVSKPRSRRTLTDRAIHSWAAQSAIAAAPDTAAAAIGRRNASGTAGMAAMANAPAVAARIVLRIRRRPAKILWRSPTGGLSATFGVLPDKFSEKTAQAGYFGPIRRQGMPRGFAYRHDFD